MSSRPGRWKTESIVSVVLLILLVLVGVGIFFKQFYYDAGRLDIALAAAQTSAQPKVEGSINLVSLLPAGFGAMTEREIFGRDSLYVKIDGKADLYLQSGFEELLCRRFVSGDDEKLWAEIYLYDMGTARNAFAVYSTQRRANAVKLPVSRFSYKADSAVFFTTANYYVEIIAAVESDKLHDAVLTVAGNIAKLPHKQEDSLGELKLFPESGLIADSFKLHLTSAFGFEGFDDTFTAKYRLGEEAVTAFISQKQSYEEANKIAGNYCQFLIDNGAVLISAVNANLGGKVLDFYDSTEIILVSGPFILGVHEAYDRLSAEKVAIMLKEKVMEAGSIDSTR